MNARTSNRRARWARREKIAEAVEIARELGLDVAGFQISPDGSVSVFESRATPTPVPGVASSDFDRFEAQL